MHRPVSQIIALIALLLPYSLGFTQIFVEIPNSMQAVIDGDISCGDYNSDGFFDVLITGELQSGTPTTKVYLNKGDNTFSEVGAALPGVTESTTLWDDYDTDGDIDAFVTGIDNGDSAISFIIENNNSTLVYKDTSLTEVGKENNYRFDYDNDGDLDSLHITNTNTKILKNDGQGNFYEIYFIDFPIFYNGTFDIIDINNDNKIDLIFTGQDTSGTYVTKTYLNQLDITNEKPSTPSNLSFDFALLKCIWYRSSDLETKKEALSYNFRAISLPDSTLLISHLSRNDGKRLVNRQGNTDTDTTLIIDIQLDTSKTYLWSVQAIDNQNTGSEWSEFDTLNPLFHPVPRLYSPLGKNTNEYNIPVNIQWFQPITGFDSTDIIITNGTLASLNQINAATWSAIVNPNFNGQITVQIPSAVAINADSLGNLASKLLKITYQPFTKIAYELPNTTWTSTTWGDVDRDGDKDIVATNDTITKIFENRGDGSFSTHPFNFAGHCDNLGDYNNDGYLDIITKDPVHENMQPLTFTNLYKNNGNKSYTIQPDNFSNVSNSALWGDYNRDGLTDLLLSGTSDFDASDNCNSNNHEHLDLFKNMGNGNFQFMKVGLRPLDGFAVWVDLNDDGFQDVLSSGVKCVSGGVIGGNTNVYNSFLNIEGNNFTQLDRSYRNVETITTVDFDNDGDMDILRNGQLLKKEENFVTHPTFIFKGKGKAAWADLNNDGFLDVVRGSYVYLNDQQGSFILLETQISGNGPVSCADYDNDGDMDIVNGKSIYKNNIKKPNNAPSTPVNAQFDSILFVFSWLPSTDIETPDSALSYNIRMGTSPGANNIISPNALNNGTSIVDGYGNLGQTVNYSYRHFKPGETYYWSIQSVDNQWGRSAWTEEQIIDFSNYSTVTLQTANDTIDVPNFDVDIQFSDFVNNFDSLDILLSNAEIVSFQTINDGLEYRVSLVATQRNVSVQIPAGAVINLMGKSNFPSNLVQVIFNEFTLKEEKYKSKNTSFHDAVSGYAHKESDLNVAQSYSILLNDYTKISDTILVENIDGSPLAWADFNADDLMDLVLCDGDCRLYLNNGDSTFNTHPTIIDVPLNASYISTADIDNDGDIDLHINSYIFYNDGTGTFERQVSSDGQTVILQGDGASWGDFNKDGYPDLLKENNVYINESGQSFSEYTTEITTTGNSEWADVNNDGFLDILIADELYVNTGLGDFIQVITSMQRTDELNIGDYNNDGFLDVFNGISLYKNNGDFTFDYAQTDFPEMEGQIVLGDFDSDNDLDVYMQGINNDFGYIAVYDNQISTGPQNITFENLNATLQQYLATFSWEVKNNPKVCTYNVRIGVTPGGEEIVPSGNTDNNIRMEAKMGNAQTANIFHLDLTNLLQHLPSNKLYWSVQPIYHDYSAGSWAPEQELPVNAVADFFAPSVCALDTTPFLDLSFGSQFEKWIWDFGDGTIDTISSAENGNTTHVYQKGGLYDVTLTVLFGAISNSISKTLAVLYTPDASFTVDSICEGDVAMFTDLSNTDSILSFDYYWDFGDESSSTIPGNTSHAYTITDTATLTIYTDKGCFDIDTQIVLVTNQPIPVIIPEIPGLTQYCNGDTVKLVDENADEDFTYQWYISNIKLVDDTSSNLRLAVEDGTYAFRVEVTNPIGNCTVSDEEIVTVDPTPAKPNITAYPNDSVCENSSMYISTGSVGDITYNWLSNGQSVSNNDTLINPPTGYYSLEIENAVGCTPPLSDSVYVLRMPVPEEVNWDVIGSTEFCEGDSLVLSVPDNPDLNFEWYINGLFNNSDTLHAYSVKDSGIVELFTSNTFGCSILNSSISTKVFESPPKPVIDLISSSETICPGDLVTMQVEFPSDQYEYVWKKNGIEINIFEYELSSYLNEGAYTIKCSQGNCSSESDAITVNYQTALAKPELYVFGPNVWFFACSNDSILGSYRWKRDGTVVESSEEHMYFAVDKMGSYSVEINDGQSECWISSDTITIPTDDYIGKEFQPQNKSAIYPNPASESINVDLSGEYTGEILITIFDNQGIIHKQLSIYKDIQEFNYVLNISELSKGSYTVQIRMNGVVETFEIIKI